MSWSKEELNKLRSLYEPGCRTSCRLIARVMGKSLKSVQYMVARLGLRGIDRNFFWTEEDESYLRRSYHWKTYTELSAVLQRTISSIKNKASSLDLTKKESYYSANEVAEGFGVDARWVTRRIEDGRLAVQQPTGETRSYYISEGSIVEYIRTNPFDIDLSKVDSLWLMSIISYGLTEKRGK